MIFSGWTNEADIQYAVRRTKKFKMINHLIWQYSFGVNTTKKFVSSHYHILYFCKNKGKPYFNQYAYHNEDHNVKGCGSEVYKDLQDVIKINKEYKPDKIKNCNTLPTKLIEKLIKHTTKSGDVVLDIFSGGFTTQFAAIKLKRLA
jgi:site-specific DNA-methyltransferase (adenine-specific)